MVKIKSAGFTLIELLVVISIIAILAVIGATTFRGVTRSAADAKEQSNIDSIVKAYETHFDPVTGRYPVLLDSWFSGGVKPTRPDDSDYPGELTVPSSTGFQICTTLSDSSTYCRESTQIRYVASYSTPYVYPAPYGYPTPADTTPPVISNISSGTPGQTSATITWTTDESADSRVNYGVTTSYGSTQFDATLVTSHSINLTGLNPGQLYHYQVVSRDAATNTATSSDNTFTTAAAYTTPPYGYPTPASGPFIESGGQVVIEAEHFTTNVPRTGHSWVLRTLHAGYQSDGEMASEPDNVTITETVADSPELTYQVNFVTTGTYYLWFRGWAPDGAGNSLKYSLDSGPISGIIAITSAFGSWVWNSATLTVNVTTTGTHTIHIFMREDGLSLDRFVLQTSATAPSGTGPLESNRL